MKKIGGKGRCSVNISFNVYVYIFIYAYNTKKEVNYMTDMCRAIADYIIFKTNEIMEKENININMSCKRLQKILFFSEIEYMKQNNGNALTKDDFYAWPSGPVIPSVYNDYMLFQNGVMFPKGKEYLELSDTIKTVIDKIINSTKNVKNNQLIEISHIENGPWYKHKNDKSKISKEEIYNFYKDIEINYGG